MTVARKIVFSIAAFLMLTASVYVLIPFDDGLARCSAPIAGNEVSSQGGSYLARTGTVGCADEGATRMRLGGIAFATGLGLIVAAFIWLPPGREDDRRDGVSAPEKTVMA